MSGHSKWHNIKLKKGKVDAQRGALFTKLSKEIILAAKGGSPDPEANYRLKMAVEKAREFKYHDKGTMAAIGRGSAVVQMLGGRTMKGKAAQIAWGTVHLALLPTNEDRAKAVVAWSGAALTHQRAGRITVTADD